MFVLLQGGRNPAYSKFPSSFPINHPSLTGIKSQKTCLGLATLHSFAEMLQFLMFANTIINQQSSKVIECNLCSIQYLGQYILLGTLIPNSQIILYSSNSVLCMICHIQIQAEARQGLQGKFAVVERRRVVMMLEKQIK